MGCGTSTAHPPIDLDDLNYEAIAALRLGGSGPKKRQTASVHRVFEELPYVNRPEDVLFPVDAVPIAQLTALLRNPKLGLYCGFAMEQGKRSYMEDRLRCVPDVPAEVPGLPGFMTPSCFFGVFDGHGGQGGRVGDEVAEYLMKHLVHRLYAELTKHVDRYLRIQAGDVEALDGQSSPPGDVVAPSLAPTVPAGLSALALQVRKLSMANLVQPDFHNIATSVFRNIDAEVLSQGFLETAGSTCTVATLFGDALIVINTGDSDAVLCRNGEPKKLTVAHKAADPSEAQRIANAGGFVANVNGVWRVAGMLEVSRDIGCELIKRECPGLIPDPHVTVVELCELDEFLVIASDGLFEVYTNLKHLVREIKESLRATKSVDLTCKQIVSGVVRSFQSNDNVSMILVVFNRDGVITAQAGACSGKVGYAATARPMLRAPAVLKARTAPTASPGIPAMTIVPPVAPAPALPPPSPTVAVSALASSPGVRASADLSPAKKSNKERLLEMLTEAANAAPAGGASKPASGTLTGLFTEPTAGTGRESPVSRPVSAPASKPSTPAVSVHSVDSAPPVLVTASEIGDVTASLGDVDFSVDGAADAADGSQGVYATVV